MAFLDKLKSVGSSLLKQAPVIGNVWNQLTTANTALKAPIANTPYTVLNSTTKTSTPSGVLSQYPQAPANPLTAAGNLAGPMTNYVPKTTTTLNPQTGMLEKKPVSPTVTIPVAGSSGSQTISLPINGNPTLSAPKPGVTTPAIQTKVTPPSSLQAEQLTSGKNFSTAPQVYPTTNPDTFVSSISQYNQANAQQMAQMPPVSDVSTKRLEDLINQYSASSDKLGGSGQRLQEIQNQLGIQQQTKQLQDLNTQIAQLTGAYDKGITNAQGQVIPMQFITGQQAQMRQQGAAEIGALTAVQQALQGNIALSQQTAEQAVNLEFADEEQNIKKLQALIGYEYDSLSRADKLRADEQNRLLDARQQEIDAKKEERTSIMSIATQAAQNGAPSELVRQILSSGNMEGALEYATPYFSDMSVSESKPITEKIGDKMYQYNPADGSWTEVANAAGVPGQVNSSGMSIAAEKAISNVGVINDILGDANLSKITGIPGASAFIPGTATQLVKNKFDQLKALLSLDSRSALKGQGTITDYEAKMLENASSALGKNLSDADAVKVLTGIKEAFQRGALKAQGYTQEEIDEAAAELGGVEKVYTSVFSKPLSKGVNGSIQKVVINNKPITVNSSIADKIVKADAEMFRATGQHLQINQSYRTYEQQAKLYAELKPKGAQVAPPGKSFHETGNAIDVTNWKEAQPYLNKYGLLNPMANDKGHFSYGEFKSNKV